MNSLLHYKVVQPRLISTTAALKRQFTRLVKEGIVFHQLDYDEPNWKVKKLFLYCF